MQEIEKNDLYFTLPCQSTSVSKTVHEAINVVNKSFFFFCDNKKNKHYPAESAPPRCPIKFQKEGISKARYAVLLLYQPFRPIPFSALDRATTVSVFGR